MLVTLGPSAMILDLKYICFHHYILCLEILSTSCMHLLLSGTDGPEVTEIGVAVSGKAVD